MSHGGRSFHKKDWMLTAAALAAIAAPFAGPALFGGATAAGATGAAGAGASGAGAGLLGGGTAAGELAAGAGSGLAGSLMAPSVTPMIAALAPEAAVGGSSMFGAGTGANALSAMGILPEASEASIWQMLGKGSKNTLEAFDKAQKLQKMARGPEPLAPAPAGRPPQGGGGSGNELAALMALMSNPVGQEQLKRLMRG